MLRLTELAEELKISRVTLWRAHAFYTRKTGEPSVKAGRSIVISPKEAEVLRVADQLRQVQGIGLEAAIQKVLEGHPPLTGKPQSPTSEPQEQKGKIQGPGHWAVGLEEIKRLSQIWEEVLRELKAIRSELEAIRRNTQPLEGAVRVRVTRGPED